MIVLRFGRWSHMAGRKYVYNRYYFKGYKWTPFCYKNKRYVMYQKGE